MNAYLSLFLIMLLATSGCATAPTVSVQTNPLAEVTGDRVYIAVFNSEGKRSDSVLAGIITEAAISSLKEKGFKPVSARADAHTVIAFYYGGKSEEVYVPPSTVAIPVYSQGGTTTTVKNSFGQTLGTLETAPSNPYAPTGYQTINQGGYNATIRNEWLEVYAGSYSFGKFPTDLFRGRAIKSVSDSAFLASPDAVKTNVRKLISQANLKAPSRSTANDSQRPGCRKRFGLPFDPDIKEKENRVVLTGSEDGALKAGLRPGDEITSINGKQWDSFFADRSEAQSRIEAGDSFQIGYLRDGKRRAVSLTPTLACD